MSQDITYLLGLDSVGASIAIWNLTDRDHKANTERFGSFVGLSAPTLFAIDNGLGPHRSNADS